METQEKELLLISISELFMKFGIKSLTMDDISRNLGISKKTLYQITTDKKDLVKQCIDLMINMENKMLCEYQKINGNAIDEMLLINVHIGMKFQKIQPAVLFDLQKYFPEAWKEIENHKYCTILEVVKDNIEKGKSEGLYRETINAEIVAKIYIGLVDKMFEPDFFLLAKKSIEELYIEIAGYHIRGIASDKGLKYLQKKLIDEKLNF